LWANGDKPRKDDTLVWKREDLSDKDGTHPSDSGRQKVAELLLAFFKKQPWFAAQ
jgi:lysophospholipase L1-like esterase